MKKVLLKSVIFNLEIMARISLQTHDAKVSIMLVIILNVYIVCYSWSKFWYLMSQAVSDIIISQAMINHK